MKAVQVTAGIFLVLSGGALMLTVSRVFGDLTAVRGLTENCWLPIVFFVILLSAMTIFLTFRDSAKKKGKKGFGALFMACIFAAGALFSGYTAISHWIYRDFYRLTEIQSPDGANSVWQGRRSDVLGNTCYVYYRRVNMLGYELLFDAGSDVSMDFQWQTDGLVYGQKTYPYSDYTK